MSTRIKLLPEIYPVTSHTDHVGQGSTFVVIKGVKEDGIKYIPLALERGAKKIVIESSINLDDSMLQLIHDRNAELISVPNTRAALASLSAQAWNHPAKQLKIIGATGTKGKTTSVFLLQHLFRSAGYNVALLSTVRNQINEAIYPTSLTTTQPDYLHMFLAEFLAVTKQSAAPSIVVMELSAQAASLHRVDGMQFDGIIFTNFSQEHGEFYPTIDAYFADKCQLLTLAKDPSQVLVNADDSWGRMLLEQHAYTPFGLSFNTQWIKFQSLRAIIGKVFADTAQGIGLSLSVDGRKQEFFLSSLVGTYNIYNLLGALSMAYQCGLTTEEIKHGLTTFTAVPGRMERYQLPKNILGIIDYAHNPSSYQAVLPTLKAIASQLIAVFGCGGDRDASKRPIMGNIAAEVADLVIITTDNPRSEDPATIYEQIIAGIPDNLKHKVILELDRAAAIKLAYSHAKPNAIIALLGKGPDEYQMVKGEKIYFSEREILRSISHDG